MEPKLVHFRFRLAINYSDYRSVAPREGLAGNGGIALNSLEHSTVTVGGIERLLRGNNPFQ